VTTTRLIQSTPPDNPVRRIKPIDARAPSPGRPYRCGADASALRVLLEKFGCVAHGQNRLRGIVRNLATELFFKCHHKLDGVETVSAEVVNEARVVDHFFGLNT